MAGWKLRVKRLFPLFFLVIFLLQILTPLRFAFLEVTPASAAEEEEEDGFRQMPNWRWRNVSTTSGSVTENLIEDIYQVYSVNNPSGTATFRKGRTLNSRDFYFNSRFALDIGGSTVEVFNDERGDACDWEEGDYDGVQGWAGGVVSLSVAGSLRCYRTASDSYWGFEFPNMVGMNLYTSVYRWLEFRIKGTGTNQYDFAWDDYPDTPLILIDGDIPSEWTEYRIDMWEFPAWLDYSEVGRHSFTCSTDSTGEFLLDYIRYIGVMDYASFYQGEIENAWDFDEYGDTPEYWKTVYGDVMDFNDGSVEAWNVDWASENMIAELLFNTGSGTTYEDSSGYNNDFSTIAQPAWDSDSVNPAYSWCLDFEESDNEWIYSDDDVFDFNEGAKTDLPMAYSVWIRPESRDNKSCITAMATIQWDDPNQNGNFRFTLYDGDNSFNQIWVNHGTTIPIDSWSHLVLSYNGNETKEGLDVYLNGDLDVGSRGSQGSYGGHKDGITMRIGGSFAPSWESFDGKMDNFRVFNRSLTSDEVALLYANEPDNIDNPPPEISNYANNWLNTTDYVVAQPIGISEEGLICRYKFDEGSGENITDSSINELNGTYELGKGPENWRTHFNYAIGLDEDYGQVVFVPDDDLLSFDGDVPFSIEAWIQLDTVGAHQMIVSKYGAIGREYWFMVDSSNKLNFWLYDINGDYIYVEGTTSLALDNWYYVCATYDGSNSEDGLKVYLNASDDSANRYESNYDGMANTGEKVIIGSQWGAKYYNGTIDEFRMWDYELSASDISTLFSIAPDIGGVGGDRENIIYTDAMNPAINRDTYQWLEMEITNVRGTIEEINVYNKTDVLMFSYPYNISQGTTEHIWIQGTGDWTGTASTSDYLKLEVLYYFEPSNFLSEYHMNYSYFRSFGSIYDDWDNVNYIFVEDDAVYFEGNSTNDFELMTLRNIPSEYFENFRLKIKGTENGKYQLKAYDGSSWVNMTSLISFTTEWETYEQSLRLVEDWTSVSNQRKLGIQFYNSSGLPIDAFNQIGIDFIQLLGHFDEQEGFKFGLWTEEDVEGMYFKFTREGSGQNESYVLTIDMLDSTGIALHFAESFQYDYFTDGWLRIDLDFHIDKKKVKLTLEHDNGTDIIKTRSIGYLYSKIPSQLRLLITAEGYPSLVLDNSITGFSKSIVWLDYIDADWQTVEWIEESAGSVWDEDNPDPPWIVNWYSSGYPYQNSRASFSAISPYVMSQFHESANGIGHYYWLNIDRFDGFKFDLRFFTDGFTGVDEEDYIRFYCDTYEVMKNGQTYRVSNSMYEMYKTVGSYWTHIVYHNGPDGSRQSHIVDLSTTRNYMEISYSFFRESEQTLILQDTFDNGDITGQNDLTFERTGRWTQEFIVLFYYYLNITAGGHGNDEVRLEIRGFDVTRKDILGGIVSAILSPILFVLGIILTPVILILQALMIALAKLFGTLLAGLTGALTPILTGIITALGVFLEPILDFVGEILELINEFAPLLLEIFLAAIEEYVTFLEEFWGLVIDAIILPFLFDLFDSLGLLPLLEFILVFIGDLMLIIGDVIALVTAFFGYLFASALYWFHVGRLGALAMWLIFFVVVYVFSPLLALWKTDFDKLELEQITDAFALMFERVFSIFVFAFTFTTYLFSFIFDVLKTIGNYIPFT